MTPKSYITLCVAGILYVIMAATAILSPHGNSYALTGNGSTVITGTDSSQEKPEPAYTTPLTGLTATVKLTNEKGDVVELPLEGMPVFKANKITVDTQSGQKTFTAADFSSVIAWSGMPTSSDMIVIKSCAGQAQTYRTIDLTKTDNAYLIYADENGNALDSTVYGTYCFYVKDGKSAGLFTNVEIIDFG